MTNKDNNTQCAFRTSIIGVREHDFEAAIKAIYDIFVVSQL